MDTRQAYTQPVEKHCGSAIALEHFRDVLYDLDKNSVNFAW